MEDGKLTALAEDEDEVVAEEVVEVSSGGGAYPGRALTYG